MSVTYARICSQPSETGGTKIRDKPARKDESILRIRQTYPSQQRQPGDTHAKPAPSPDNQPPGNPSRGKRPHFLHRPGIAPAHLLDNNRASSGPSPLSLRIPRVRETLNQPHATETGIQSRCRDSDRKLTRTNPLPAVPGTPLGFTTPPCNQKIAQNWLQ